MSGDFLSIMGRDGSLKPHKTVFRHTKKTGKHTEKIVYIRRNGNEAGKR